MKHLGLLCLLLFYITFSCAQDTLLWKFSTGSLIYSSPRISENFVYFGCGDMNLYALNKNSGKLNWKYETKGQVNSTPFIYENKIIFNSTDGNIYSLNKNTGELLWKFATKGEQRHDLWDYYLSSPVVDEGILYVGSGDGAIYAIDVELEKIYGVIKQMVLYMHLRL